MMADLALVTGASGSLGTEVAKRLDQQGVRLVLASRNEEKLQDVPIERAQKIVADLSNPESVERLFSTIAEQYGEKPSLLAHCAGNVMIRPLHRTSIEQYQTCLKNNLDSAFFTLKAFIQGVLELKKPGSAVLVSTVAAKIGVKNHEAVAASKAGVEGLMRSTAATYADKAIRVNAVAPGLIRTTATEGFFSGGKAEEQLAAQYPLGRYGKVEDVAQLLCWLLSKEAEWITGQVVAVDGGFSSIRPQVRV